MSDQKPTVQPHLRVRAYALMAAGAFVVGLAQAENAPGGVVLGWALLWVGCATWMKSRSAIVRYGGAFIASVLLVAVVAAATTPPGATAGRLRESTPMASTRVTPVAAPSRPAQPRTVTAKAPIVTANALYDAYEANEIAAENRYKDKTYRVSGEVDRIGKDILGAPYVTLKTDHVFGTVQAMFPRGDANQLAVLSKGQAITVECTIDGKLMNVILRSCKMSMAD